MDKRSDGTPRIPHRRTTLLLHQTGSRGRGKKLRHLMCRLFNQKALRTILRGRE